VPLLIRYPPAVPRGRRIRAPVTLRDLPVTVLELSGVENRVGFAGSSLTRQMDGTQSDAGSPVFATTATLGAPGGRSLIAHGMHYIRSSRGEEELYDLETDSLEEHNLAADSSASARLQALRALTDAQFPVPAIIDTP
jgi:arylsulfatase A-like enzyme